MTHVVSLEAERFHREVRLVALALAVRETLHGCAEDPTPMAVSLREMLDDFNSEPLESHELQYRFEVAAEAVPTGACIGRNELAAEIDPAIHDRVVRRAQEYLARIQENFGVSLLRRCS